MLYLIHLSCHTLKLQSQFKKWPQAGRVLPKICKNLVGENVYTGWLQPTFFATVGSPLSYNPRVIISMVSRQNLAEVEAGGGILRPKRASHCYLHDVRGTALCQGSYQMIYHRCSYRTVLFEFQLAQPG